MQLGCEELLLPGGGWVGGMGGLWWVRMGGRGGLLAGVVGGAQLGCEQPLLPHSRHGRHRHLTGRGEGGGRYRWGGRGVAL